MPETLNHYTDWEIATVINKTTPFAEHYLQGFGMVYTTDKKTVDFEHIADDRRISPFVSPYVQGQAARKRGSTVTSFQPGYIKDKETVDPDDTFRRTVGEQPVGQMTPGQRLEAAMIASGLKIDTRYRRRMEVMASQLIINGFYIMQGKDFPAVEVNFDRDAANTYTPTGGAVWSKANIAAGTATPMEDIDDMLQRFELPVSRITFGPTAWKMFKLDPQYKELINLDFSPQMAGNSNLPLGPMQQMKEQTMFVGRLASANNVPMFVDNRTYMDNDGTVKRYTGVDQVVFETSAGAGWRCYAAIQNILAELKAVPTFWRAWTTTESDLPGHFIQLESAPLLAHTDINSTGVINTAG